MGFKELIPKAILFPVLIIIFVAAVILWKSSIKADSSSENVEAPTQAQLAKDISVKPPEPSLNVGISPQEDVVIQKQLDFDRAEQKKTKYLKTELEQANLELEDEKALSEINKLKMENTGTFKDFAVDGQKGLPEIKVEYIGGDSVKKEAILSMAGSNYQVKENSNLTDNIQVLSISDSGVTLNFSAPQKLTKTFDYKPE